jgi:hypothetical protein
VSVTNSVYDAPPEETAPPRGVARIRIEQMGAGGTELLAQDLLELLEWAGAEKERRDA